MLSGMRRRFQIGRERTTRKPIALRDSPAISARFVVFGDAPGSFVEIPSGEKVTVYPSHLSRQRRPIAKYMIRSSRCHRRAPHRRAPALPATWGTSRRGTTRQTARTPPVPRRRAAGRAPPSGSGRCGTSSGFTTNSFAYPIHGRWAVVPVTGSLARSPFGRAWVGSFVPRPDGGGPPGHGAEGMIRRSAHWGQRIAAPEYLGWATKRFPQWRHPKSNTHGSSIGWCPPFRVQAADARPSRPPQKKKEGPPGPPVRR